MISVNTHEAKTRLSEILAKIEKKKEKVIICRNGKPVAEMGPVKKTINPLNQHPKLKKVIIHEDPALPLDNDDWPGKDR